VGVVTRRVKWLASLGLVAVMGVGATTALATSASAKPKPRHHVHTVASAPSPPASTASFTFTVSASGIGKTLSSIKLSGSGQVDFVNDAVSLAVNLPASVAKLIPGGSAAPETVNVVLSGGTVYAQVPALATFVGEPWISVALPSSATAAIPGIFTEVGGALGNVNEILAFAKSHHAAVHSLGSSNVDGTSVTGSRVTAQVKRLSISGVLWANSSGQLVQARVSVARRTLDLSAVVNFTGYDAPVTITAPPSSQVRAIPLSLITTALGGFLHHGHGAIKH
jgi:hypothetical protein